MFYVLLLIAKKVLHCFNLKSDHTDLTTVQKMEKAKTNLTYSDSKLKL